MTIITALYSGGKVYFGYNDGMTIGDSPFPGKSCPWVRLGRWAIGVSGSTNIFNILGHHAHDFDDSQSSAANMVFKIRSLLIQYNLGGRDGEGFEDQYGIWCILANVDGEIWDLDNKMAYTEVQEGTLWARGSGTEYALGADFVSSQQGFSPEDRIKWATDAAIANDLYCCGQSKIQILT